MVLALQQLAKAQSTLVFQKHLKGFSAASGSMENLYFTILTRIDEDYKDWVREIIRWLVVTNEVLSVKDLRHLVEWCLYPDTLIDFKRFLEVDCGSILHLPRGEEYDIVRFVHETFRSFVVNPNVCPQSFLVNETDTHGYVALKCLQCLTNAVSPEECIRYSARYWANHLTNATSVLYSRQLLTAIHQLFISEGLTVWVKQLCVRYGPHLQTSMETKRLRDIMQWLRTCAAQPNVKEDGIDTQFEDALGWRCTVLDDPWILGEAMGKAAANIWLHESLKNCSVLFGCFSLALKHYLRRTDRLKTNVTELKELVVTRFKPISLWAAHDRLEIPILNTNIGLALYALYRWDECIDCLSTEDSLNDSLNIRRYLALSFIAKRDYDSVIQLLENHSQSAPDLLRQAYEAKREYDTAIKIFQDVYASQTPTREIWESLFRMYEIKGDYGAMIEMLQSTLSESGLGLHGPELWVRMVNTFGKMGQNAKAVAMFQAIVDECPNDWYSWFWFGELYNKWGDHDGAIRIFEQGILKCSDHMLYNAVIRTQIAKGDYDMAIQTLNSAIDKLNPGPRAYLLSRAYKSKGDHDGLIRELNKIVDKYPKDVGAWIVLGREYIENGDLGCAIKVYKMAIESPGFSSWDLEQLHHSLFRAYTESGDCAQAIKISESMVKLESFNTPFWLSNLFDVYEDMCDYDGAIKTFRAVVDTGDDREKWAWPGLLKATAAKGEFDYVFKELENAFDNGRLLPWAEIGYIVFDVHKERGEFDRAIQKLSKMVDLLPLESWTWHLLGEAYKTKGDYERAIEIYHTALELISTDYSFYKCLCDLYLAMYDYPRVLECYETVNRFAKDQFLWAYLRFRPLQFHRSQITIDCTLQGHFLWHSVCEAYKKLGNHIKANELYGVAASKCEAAIDEKYNSLLWFHTGVNFNGNGSLKEIFDKRHLPVEILWFAAGEAYRANGNMKSALKAFIQAQTLQPQNAFLRDLVCELERTLYSSTDDGIVARANLESSLVIETMVGTKN